MVDSDKGRPRFVLFGSSIVRMCYRDGGWGSILSDLYALKADIVLRGYSGWNTRLSLQALDHIFPKDATSQPSLVIVYFGGNDSVKPDPSGRGSHVPLPEYIDNMRKIILHLKGLSDKTRIICLTCPPVNEVKVRETFGNAHGDPAEINEVRHVYSAALIDLCRELDVEAIDLWSALHQRDDCFIDPVHLSAEGCKIVAKEILKVLKMVKWEPSLYWLSMPVEFPGDSPYYPVGRKSNSNPNDGTFIYDWQKEWADV